MIAIGIISAPRARPTIKQSIASFRNAGFAGDVQVYAEPGSDVVVSNEVHYHWNETTKGNFRNWIHALESLLAAQTNWVMICEDDISWAFNAAEILEYDLSKFDVGGNAGALSLYCPIRMSKVLERDYANSAPLMHGWYGARLGKGTWGAQCLVLHRYWAHKLLADKVLLAYLANARWEKNVDLIVADTVNRAGREIVYRIPCLVDHTFGDGNSSLGYKVDRPELKTKYFKELQ
jgi:hypothetical protein